MLMSLLVTSCISFFILFGNCYHNKCKHKHSPEIVKLNKKLGLYITADTNIQKYKFEHQTMYRNEDGTIDEAKYLESQSNLALKHPTEYCRKYLKVVIPKRDITGLYGEPDIVQLAYLHGANDGREIITIRCELPIIVSRLTPLTYYIAEAPQHCAYTIMRNGKKFNPFKIVSKVCNFENDYSSDFKYTRYNLKNKIEGMSRTDQRTGIPVACDDLIEEYEYQHQEMHKKEDGTIDEVKCRSWPINQVKSYLTSICSHYLKALVPNRGKDMNYMTAIVEKGFTIYNFKNKGLRQLVNMIQCQLQPDEDRQIQLNYYLTEAPDKNCFFAFLRPNRKLAFNIVFCVCGFIGSFNNDLDMADGIKSIKPNILKQEDQLKCDNK